MASHAKPRRRAANSTSSQRLKQDYARLMKDPIPYVVATPMLDNILEWHYVVAGPENTPYEGGYYHGKLVFPADYPFKPPSIYMITPNGRFKCNTRLCLSISDFHPDTWNPAWSVSTILTGLLSFMLEDQPTLGSISTTTEVKRVYATQSLSYNLADKAFCDLFPDLAKDLTEELHENIRAARDGSNATDASPTIAQQGDDNSSMVNNLVLLGAVALIGYLVHMVIKNTQDMAS